MNRSQPRECYFVRSLIYGPPDKIDLLLFDQKAVANSQVFGIFKGKVERYSLEISQGLMDMTIRADTDVLDLYYPNIHGWSEHDARYICWYKFCEHAEHWGLDYEILYVGGQLHECSRVITENSRGFLTFTVPRVLEHMDKDVNITLPEFS